MKLHSRYYKKINFTVLMNIEYRAVPVSVPDPDPLVRGTDPDPFIIEQSQPFG
jgi:hypothetical protein